MRWRVAILTASDKGARGERKDTSAQVIRELVEEELQGDIIDYRIVPDELHDLAASLIELADDHHADLIITTGGTGLAPRDVTPEATMTVIGRAVPGLAEAMRAASMLKTRRAMLSRGICGIRNGTLIVNLPGSPRGAYENLMAIIDQLPHALRILSEQESEHR